MESLQKKFFCSYKHIFETLEANKHETAQKTEENIFLQMCLRIIFCNLQLVSRTRLLKSLYPTVHISCAYYKYTNILLCHK
jgi:hypothetical protein